MPSRLLQSKSLASLYVFSQVEGICRLQLDILGPVRNVSPDSSMLFVCFRDSPVVQGNSILALSGLAAVLAKYESNLPADSDGSLTVTHLIYMLCVVLSVICVFMKVIHGKFI